MNLGWHYTSKKNWEVIQVTGLRPYYINKPELDIWYDHPVKGIWVWMSPLKGLSHVGSIFWQVSTKKTLEVVELEVQYKENDLLRHEDFPGGKVVLHHKGNMGDYIYHDHEKSTILVNKIKPRRIKLIAEYDLLDLLKEPQLNLKE